MFLCQKFASFGSDERALATDISLSCVRGLVGEPFGEWRCDRSLPQQILHRSNVRDDRFAIARAPPTRGVRSLVTRVVFFLIL